MPKGIWLLVAAVPAVVVGFLGLEQRRMSGLVERYECLTFPCVRALPDGSVIRLLILGADGRQPTSGTLILENGGRRWRVASFTNVDWSYRTHVAVVPDTRGARVLVWDGTPDRGNVPLRRSFALTGHELVPSRPVRDDHRVFEAMASFEDRGSFARRLTIGFLAEIVLPVYGALLLITALALRVSMGRGRTA